MLALNARLVHLHQAELAKLELQVLELRQCDAVSKHAELAGEERVTTVEPMDDQRMLQIIWEQDLPLLQKVQTNLRM
eukprot:11208868-Lingulodinium_polyedra.AAC.1